jgi:HD superfamily phosphohydrolase
MAVKSKTSISDEKVKEILIDGINSGANYILNKSNFYEHIRTIYKIEKQRCLRLYDKYYLEAQESLNAKKEEVGTRIAEDAVNRAILTKLERMEIASKIAKGELWKVQGEIMIPSTTDRLKALEYLSKIDGDFAAVKKDITVENKGVSGFILED